MRNIEVFTPEGFQEHLSPSNFVQALGPMYKREREDGTTTIALRVLERHLNLHGIAHGGLIATLIDNAIGYNVAIAFNGSVVTAHLAIDYLSSARLGDWVEADVQINRKGRRMCFAECTVRNGRSWMARASCILAPVH